MRCGGRLCARVWRALLMLAVALAAVAQAHDLEYAVKATYLHKLIPFVQWPGGLHAGTTTPWVICIGGPDPFGPLLDEAVAGITIDGRPLIARRLEQTAAGRSERAERTDCHVLFARGSPSAIASQLQQVQGLPVLTVTEELDLGVVTFVMRDDRVRFIVDERHANRQGLRLSSRLLQLSLRQRNIGGSAQ